MDIAVIGTGYVGLVSGVGFAELGHRVTCVDSDASKIDRLRRGVLPIYERGLEALLHRHTATGHLRFESDPIDAVYRSAAIFIAVGTPPGPQGDPDLSQVQAAAQTLAAHVDEYKVIVMKSTVPVGTTRWVHTVIHDLSHDLSHDRRPAPALVDVVSNPEFLREGSAVEDFLRPYRIVVGSDSERATAVMAEIYRPLRLRGTPFLVTSPETAELIKYAANAFLATKISFINEVANLCEHAGADVHDVAHAVGLDGRIGPAFLRAGPGFGGSCFPKDLLALTKMGQRLGHPLRIAETVLEVNALQQQRVVQKVQAALDPLEDREVAVLGLSFKAGTDDVRDSPAIAICRWLLEQGVRVRVYDPASMANARAILNGTVAYCRDAYEAAAGSDALVVATEWGEFRDVDFGRVRALMANPLVIDCRNLLEPKELESLGFTYLGMGRPRSSAAARLGATG